MPQRSMFFKGKRVAAAGSESQQEGPRGRDKPEELEMYKDDAGSGREKVEHNGSVGWCSRENVVAAGHLLWQSFRESYSSRSFLFLIFYQCITLWMQISWTPFAHFSQHHMLFILLQQILLLLQIVWIAFSLQSWSCAMQASDLLVPVVGSGHSWLCAGFQLHPADVGPRRTLRHIVHLQRRCRGCVLSCG